MQKPNKVESLMPEEFGGIKNNFSSTLQNYGFEPNIAQILQGDNLNYMIDAIGKELKYLKTVVDYIRDIDGGKVPFITGSEMTAKTFDELLPDQTNNAGKFLTTNGTTASWSDGSTDIGDPIFTLNFNKTLSSDYIWLDGRELAVSDYPELFAIYGYTYSDTTGSANFKVPNFTNCTIWGGTTAGKVEAGLPNIKGTISAHHGANGTGVFTGSTNSGDLTDRGEGGGIGKYGTIKFNAHEYNSTYKDDINTVQPPAIKVRAYTRVR